MQKITHNKHGEKVFIFVDNSSFAEYVKDGDVHRIIFNEKEIDMYSDIVNMVHGYVDELSHTDIWKK